MTRITCPEGEIYAPDLVLTPEQIEAARAYIRAGVTFDEKENALVKLLPPDTYAQLYGNGNILKIKTIEREESDD